MELLAIDDFKAPMMIWNYILLIIPFFVYKFLKLYLDRYGLKRFADTVVSLLAFVVWMLFLPNAAYVIFDIRHIAAILPSDGHHLSAEIWKLLFIFAYGLIGWIAYAVLIEQMRALIAKHANRFAALVFICTIMPLLAIGIMMGLIFRLNSWDAFVHPSVLISAITTIFTNGEYVRNHAMFTFWLFLLYCLGKKIISQKIYEYI